MVLVLMKNTLHAILGMRELLVIPRATNAYAALDRGRTAAQKNGTPGFQSGV